MTPPHRSPTTTNTQDANDEQYILRHRNALFKRIASFSSVEVFKCNNLTERHIAWNINGKGKGSPTTADILICPCLASAKTNYKPYHHAYRMADGTRVAKSQESSLRTLFSICNHVSLCNQFTFFFNLFFFFSFITFVICFTAATTAAIHGEFFSAPPSALLKRYVFLKRQQLESFLLHLTTSSDFFRIFSISFFFAISFTVNCKRKCM